MATSIIKVNSPAQEVQFDAKTVNRFLHPVRIMIAGI
jgi:hypothetical protein